MNWDHPTEDPRLNDDGFESWQQLYATDLGLDDMTEREQHARFQRWVRDAQWEAGEDLAAQRAEDRVSSWAGYYA